MVTFDRLSVSILFTVPNEISKFTPKGVTCDLPMLTIDLLFFVKICTVCRNKHIR